MCAHMLHLFFTCASAHTHASNIHIYTDAHYVYAHIHYVYITYIHTLLQHTYAYMYTPGSVSLRARPEML